MAFIHNTSSECPKEQLDIFALPQTQVSIEEVEYLEYKPTASIENDGEIEFNILPSDDHYIDVSQTYLSLCASIVDDDYGIIDDDDNVGTVNLPFHSFFSNVSVALNNKTLSPPTHLYPYRAYFETLFNYNCTAKESHQTLALYYKDTAGKMNSLTENLGLLERKKHFEKSKIVAMFGKVSTDILGQSKFLINGVGLNIVFSRAKAAFCLMHAGTQKYCVKIHSAILHVKRVKIAPSILLAHHKVLQTATAKYPVSRVDVKNFTIPNGSSTHSIDVVFSGQLPVRVIIAFVLNSAVNGSAPQNPFNFQHFDLNYLSLTRDGVPVTSKPIQPIFTGENLNYALSFFSCFSGTSIYTKDDGFGVSRDDYINGYVVHCFDLTSDSSVNSHQWSLRKNGVIGLDLRFGAALPATISCIAYGEFQNLVEIDHNRRVLLDY